MIWIIAGFEKDALYFMYERKMPMIRGLVRIVTRPQQLAGVRFEARDAVYTLQSAGPEMAELVRHVAYQSGYDLRKGHED
jgi:hypothetical protein